MDWGRPWQSESRYSSPNSISPHQRFNFSGLLRFEQLLSQILDKLRYPCVIIWLKLINSSPLWSCTVDPDFWRDLFQEGPVDPKKGGWFWLFTHFSEAKSLCPNRFDFSRHFQDQPLPSWILDFLTFYQFDPPLFHKRIDTLTGGKTEVSVNS